MQARVRDGGYFKPGDCGADVLLGVTAGCEKTAKDFILRKAIERLHFFTDMKCHVS